MDVSSFHRRQQEELLAMYQRQAAARQQQPAAAATAAASQPPGPSADPFEDLDAEEAGLAAIGVAAPRLGAAVAVGGPVHGLGAAAAGAGADPDVPLDLPEGINLEEARMLEAAMLGIPYAGRIPDFSAAPAPAAPLSPGTLEQHAIRREQDQAYEESLALDRWVGGRQGGRQQANSSLAAAMLWRAQAASLRLELRLRAVRLCVLLAGLSLIFGRALLTHIAGPAVPSTTACLQGEAGVHCSSSG